MADSRAMRARDVVVLLTLSLGCARSNVVPDADVDVAVDDVAADDRVSPDDRVATDAAIDRVDAAAPDVATPDVVAFDAVTPDVTAPDVARVDAPVDDAGVRCPTTFRYVAPAGSTVSRVEVTGEWTSWRNPGVAMLRGADGAFSVTTPLPPGMHAYKLLVDGAWTLDPDARRRKYLDGVENSGVLVADCRAPRLAHVAHTVDRPSAGMGRFRATVSFAAGLSGDALDATSLRATLRRDGVDRALAAPTVDASTGRIAVDAPSLADGRYVVTVTASDRAGHAAAPLKLVFWVEAEAFAWQGATIYMAMADRFANGDRSNDARATSGVDPRADYQGGDFQGLRARVADGTLDRLGVRAIWLAPVNRNADGAWLAANGRNLVMGYHGYWPVRAREVEPRLGGEMALHALIAEAHAHGIRVLQDFVVNHVHREHEYFRAHPEWFRTGCVCGTAGCDWTERRLDCLFTGYLPDVNWTVPAAVDQLADDAAFWIDRFEFDGLRVDAVKHVEDIAVYNLRARLADEFESTGERVFLTGETAMGWSDCGVDCNRAQYDTISRYVGPRALDGQADFVLYHAVPYRAFSSDERGMLHVDYWTRQSQLQYPAGSIMTPYLGSHDTARFVTLATYRGQAPGLDPAIPGHQWDDIAAAPRSADAYARHRAGMTWVLTIPGAPLVYYGDEYGEWGGADPNNRRMWRDPTALTADETATLTHVRALGTARRELEALRRGEYVSLDATEETLVFARRAGERAAVVGISRAAVARTVTARLPAGFPLADGTVLRDRLGGASVTVRGGAVAVALAPWGSAVLAP